MKFPSSNDQLCEDLLGSCISDLERLADQHKIEDLQLNFFKDIVIPISLYLDSFPKREEPYLICFTNLIFVEDWLIERKVDLTINETKCRASIPSHASWFGARVRLGTKDELIKPIWISIRADQVLDSKLAKIRALLDDCRSGLLFLPEKL